MQRSRTMSVPAILGVLSLFADESLPAALWVVVGVLVVFLGCILLLEALGTRYIPNSRVGIVEKLWSPKGSVTDGRIMALGGEAGFQADLLRGGIHFGLWRWQYRIHRVALVTVPQGKIGYVYARDGEPLQPSQTLARVVSCNYFQDARAFLGQTEKGDHAGQRGRQRAILREGVYAINLALFVVITEDAVYRLSMQDARALEKLVSWQHELRRIDGFSPVLVGAPVRSYREAAEIREVEAAEDEVSTRRRRPRAKV